MDRIIYGFLTAFTITLLLGPILIDYLNILKFGQNIREDGPEKHLDKQGTPSMGGIIFISGFLLAAGPYLKWNKTVMAVILVTLAFAFLGFLDDYVKIVKKRSLGLKAYQKFLLQLIISSSFVFYIAQYTSWGTRIAIPFLGRTVGLGYVYYPFAIIFMLSMVNATNLTDGIDGLLTSVTIPVLLFFAVAIYYINSYNIPFMSEIGTNGELVFRAILLFIASLFGYLIYNVYPAKVFMGDLGSHAIGGFVGAIALVLKMPLFIVIVGIIYVIETLSVILQVGFYKLTKKRIFKMAPLHHHFELSGWHEVKVVYIFLITTIIASIIGFLLI